MAINKKQSSIWVKATLIVVIIAFVATLIVPALLTGWASNPAPVDSQTGSQLERIAAQHAPAVLSGTAALEADPEDYGVLVQLGNVYYDWGLQIMTALAPGSGQDLPMWNAATVYYERALAVGPGESNAGAESVATDMAIAYFYAGNAPRAIEVIEAVFEQSPEFAPARYSGALFYRAVNRFDDARASLERYLELEPEGASAGAARTILQELEGAVSTPTPSLETTGSAEETTQP